MAKTEIELLEEINAKQDKNSQEYKEVKAYIDAKKVEDAEFAKTVEKLNTELKAKDATIGDIQKEVLELKAKRGRFSIPGMTEKKSLQDEIAEKIVEHKAAIEAGKLEIEFKSVGVITDSNFTGTNAPYRGYLDWQPGMEPTGQVRFRSFVRTIQSGLDNVSFPRANTPIGEGSFGKQATQTATKAQIDRDYTMIDLILKPMAGFAIVSRRSLVNTIFLQSWLPVSMMEQLEDQEDLEFVNTVVGAATGSVSTTGISTSGSATLKALVACIKNNIQAKFNPGAIAMDPNVWANILLNVETNAGFNLPNVVVVDPTGTVRILGRPIQPVNWLTGGRILGGDWSKVAIVQSEGLTFRQSDSHAEIFSTNQLAFLLERIENVAVFRPDAMFTAVL